MSGFNDFLIDFKSHFQTIELVFDDYEIIQIADNIVVNFIPLENNFLPEDLIQLQIEFSDNNILLVHLWEDVWARDKDKVLSRINHLLGKSKTIYARNTELVKLDKIETKQFLNQHHLQGFVPVKHNFGLKFKNEIIAVASFTAPLLMKRISDNYRSAELVRFANKNGSSVVGGLSKLINHFFKSVPVNDLMTYADCDWSLGNGYEKLNFKLKSRHKPIYFLLDKKQNSRYSLKKSIAQRQDDKSLKVFNTGSLKYYLYNER